MQFSIKNIEGLEILDSRGDPTVQVSVTLENGTRAVAAVPSGASTGTFEAFELRDGDELRFGGKGVLKAVSNVTTTIRTNLMGFDARDQRGIDDLMRRIDGTENKSKLGANAMLGVSLAVARAAALAQQLPLYRYLRTLSQNDDAYFRLPIPLVNVINGGKHASSNLDIQEFWVIPHAASQFKERLRQASEIFHALGSALAKAGLDTDLGNEGGYAPNFVNHKQVFEFILKSIEAAYLQPGADVGLGLDVGSSVFFDADAERYDLALEHESLTSEEMTSYMKELVNAYPLIALEDPLAEEDWDGWQRLTADLTAKNKKLRIIGDDLFVTNVNRLSRGIELGCANSVLIKPNQIGTLSETLDCIALAQRHGYDCAISHRSGETTDTFIADLSVAVNAAYIKTGSTARGERMAKYNRLLEIENELHGSQK